MAIDLRKAYYNDGTASVTGGSTTVNGQGTAWAQAIRRGDMFGTHVGMPTRIASVDSNTQITLAYPWAGPDQTEAAYEIQFTFDDVAYQAAVRDLLTALASGNVSALAGLASDADKFPFFTGPGAMDLADLTEFARTLLAGTNAKAMRGTLEAPVMAELSDGANLNAIVDSGFYRIAETYANGPDPTTFAYGQMIVSRGKGNDSVFQLLSDFESNHLAFRSGNSSDVGGDGSWGPWRGIWHTGNVNPLPTTGGEMTGVLSFAKQAAGVDSNWLLDTHQNSYVIADGVNLGIAIPFSGLVVLNEINVHGSCGLYLCGGGTNFFVAQSGNVFAQGQVAGKIGCDWYSPNGQYYWRNQTGGSVTLTVTAIRTRTAA